MNSFNCQGNLSLEMYHNIFKIQEFIYQQLILMPPQTRSLYKSKIEEFDAQFKEFISTTEPVRIRNKAIEAIELQMEELKSNLEIEIRQAMPKMLKVHEQGLDILNLFKRPPQNPQYWANLNGSQTNGQTNAKAVNGSSSLPKKNGFSEMIDLVDLDNDVQESSSKDDDSKKSKSSKKDQDKKAKKKKSGEKSSKNESNKPSTSKADGTTKSDEDSNGLSKSSENGVIITSNQEESTQIDTLKSEASEIDSDKATSSNDEKVKNSTTSGTIKKSDTQEEDVDHSQSKRLKKD